MKNMTLPTWTTRLIIIVAAASLAYWTLAMIDARNLFAPRIKDCCARDFDQTSYEQVPVSP